MKFDPSGWSKAAAVFEEISGSLGAITPTAAAGGGGTRTDAAVAAAVGKLAGQADRAISGLARGLSADAAAMHRTSADYQATEQKSVGMSARLAKGI